MTLRRSRASESSGSPESSVSPEKVEAAVEGGVGCILTAGKMGNTGWELFRLRGNI